MSKKKRRGFTPSHANQPSRPSQSNPQKQVATGQRVEAAMFRGPLPPPEMLQQYNSIVPGMAERLLQAFEDQASHRRAMDEKTLTLNFRLARVGQVSAFVIGVAALGSGTYLASIGHSVTGIAVMFGTIGSMVGAFLWTGRRGKRPEGQEK